MQSLYNVHEHNLFSYLERGGQKYKILYCIVLYCELPFWTSLFLSTRVAILDVDVRIMTSSFMAQ